MEGCLALLAFGVSIALLALSVISLLINAQLRQRVQKLEQQLAELKATLPLRAEHAAPAPATPSPAEAAPPATDAPVAEARVSVPEQAPMAAAAPVAAALAEPELPIAPVPPVSPAASPAVEPPATPPGTAEELHDLTPASAAPEAPEAAAGPSEPVAVEEPIPPAPPSRPGFDWERLVGVKLFSWIAAVALALAGVFFVKYGVDHGWVTAPVRMVMGLALGVGLLVLCERKFAGAYRTTANALDGAGVAILFATLFAAHDRWALVPQAAAFAGMVGVTAVAVVLSVRRDSVFIALLGLLGGFSTPALLSTGEDRPLSLFGYLLLLNAGIAWVAYRKRWPLLALLTMLFTTVYQWAWVVRFLDGARVGLAAAIFLVFPLLAVIALWLAGRKEGASPGALFERTAQMSAVLPLLFAVYGAAVGGYAESYAVLFGFLFCVDAGLAAVAAWKKDAEALHLLGGATTLLVFAVWSGFSYRSFAWPAIVWWVAVFVLLYALAPALLARIGRGYEGVARHARLAAPALLFMFTVLAEIELRAVDPRLLFGVLFALTALLAIIAARRDSGAIWLVAGFFAFSAQFSWSFGYLVPSNVSTALLLHGAFALLILAVNVWSPALGSRLAGTRAAGIVPVLQIVVVALATRQHVASQAMLLIACVVTLSLLAATAAARARRRYGLMFVAVLAAWIVLAFWWGIDGLEISVGLSLGAMLALAALSLGASVWLMRSRAEGEPRDYSPYVVLSGFVFMMVVAGNGTYALPSARFAVSLLALAAMVALTVLAARRGMLAIGAGVLAGIAVGIWVETVREAPTVTYGVLLAVSLASLATGVFALRRFEEGVFRAKLAAGAILTTFVAQTILVSSGELPGRPALPLMLGAHAGMLVFLLAVSRAMRWHAIAIVAALPATVAMYAWRGEALDPATWGGAMLLGLTLYLMLALYPFTLPEECRGRLEPYLGAIVMSVSFFVFAKESLEWIGFGAIGLVPLAQAGLLAFLLDRLARREADDAPASGTRAMMAAAVLAFVTLAVPVQLDKEFVTIAWALEVAALVWLLGKLRHPGLLAWAAGLAFVVFARLALNPAVFDYHPRSAVPIVNWYLYTYLVPAAAFFVAAWLAGRTTLEWPWLRRFATALNAGGAVLLFLLLNIEIADYFSTGESITFDFDAGLAQDLTYTLGWAVYAIALLVVGIAKQVRGARIAALGVLTAAILKCFLHDLIRLGGLYLVGSLFGLAVALAFVAVLLQKFVLRPERREA